MSARRVIAVLVVLLTSVRAVAQTTSTSTSSSVPPTSTATSTTSTSSTLPPAANQICSPSANPCVVRTDKLVQPGSFLDFGSRTLVLADGGSLSLTAPGRMTIHAGSLTLNATTALRGPPGGAGDIFVTVAGDLKLLRGSTVDVSTEDASTASIDVTADGVAVIAGDLKAGATDIFGSGGTISVTADGDMTVDGDVIAKGGGQALGGSVSLTSNKGAVTINQPIDATGGDSDGGDISIDSGTDMVLRGRIDVSGTNGGLSGYGGTVCLNAYGGGIQLLGPLVGRGQGSDPDIAGGGDGGSLEMYATGDITVNAPIALTGGGGSGSGGYADIEADGNLTLAQEIVANGNGIDSCGGELTLFAGGDLSFGNVDVHSGGSCDGSLEASADRAVRSRGTINADGGDAGLGGSVFVVAGTSAVVSGNLHANVGSGEIDLEACDLTVTGDARLTAKDTGGRTRLAASGQMTVAGTLLAAAENRLQYLDPSTPPNLTGATITPAPVVVRDPLLLPCLPSTTTSTTATTMTTIVTATTTTTPPTTCSPPDCDDGDPCTVDDCVAATGRCMNIAKTGFEAVTCRLEAIHTKALAAPSDAIRGPKLRQKIVTKADKLRGMVDAARHGGRRGRVSLRRVSRGLGALARMITQGQGRGKIDGRTGGELIGLATSAKAELQELRVP